ncbi:MAG: Protease precursor [Myxococcaceae bacterium]|nr:Protease precursor [Myxococcaceae bacterium]
MSSEPLSPLGTYPFGERKITRYVLENGLKLLLLKDPSAPVVSYHTWFGVGSRHETPGKTGLAHLFEHLMFNETENLPKGEFDRTLEAAGGEVNAATWVDWTFYYENVPSSELALVVRLEAERMQRLVLREPQVQSEKEVVANERRYRVDDDVEGAVNELLYKTAFTVHPYHWPTIGWMADIEGFTTQDCATFYSTYYAPNNATIAVVGDFDEPALLQLVQQHYGAIPSANLPVHEFQHEPEQTSERRVEIEKPTPTEKLSVGYKSPALGEPDYAALTVLNEVLFGGKSSRLYRALISEGELAGEARGSIAPSRDPGLYEIWVSLREGHTAEQALSVVDLALASVMADPVAESELEKAKNRLELGFLHGMETASGKAEQIGFYETVLGDAGRIFSQLEAYRQVTASDVREVARKLLAVSRRTTILVRAKPEPEGEADDQADDEAEAA